MKRISTARCSNPTSPSSWTSGPNGAGRASSDARNEAARTWPSRSKTIERFTVFIPLQSMNEEAAGSLGTREINPLADPPFARLLQGRLFNQKYNGRVNRFQSAFQPCTRSFLMQPGCRADAQHVCERRDGKPKRKRSSLLFVPGSEFLAHRFWIFPIPPGSHPSVTDAFTNPV